jgi:hypothetical protein
MQQIKDGSMQGRPYETPRLKLYGSVQALTAGGTGMISEATEGSIWCPMGVNTANQFHKHCA